MVRLRSAPKVHQRSPLKEKTNTTRKAPRAQLYDDKDDLDGLVKTRKNPARRRRKRAQNGDNVFMAGGLGSEDIPPSTTDELAKTDAPTLQTVRTRPSLVMPQTSQHKSMEPIATVERSCLSISPSPPPPGRLSSVHRKRSSLALPGSELRSHGTPAVESSVLKHFKRRPRQPSMLQMVAQHHASARPSAVNLAAVDDPSIFDLLDDDDMFVPEAEGTPLKMHKKGKSFVEAKKKKHRAPKAATDSSLVASKKRTSDEALSLNVLKAKRRRAVPAPSGTDEEPHSNIPLNIGNAQSSSVRQTTPLRAPASDIQVINSSPSNPSSTPPTGHSLTDQEQTNAAEADLAIPSTENEQTITRHLAADADFPNSTMAEPASSSPEQLLPVAVRSQLNHGADSSTQADPLTQVSPSPEKMRKSDKSKKSRPASTAMLQSLLPKRRQRPKPRHPKSEYDFSSGPEDEAEVLDTIHLEEDEDELSGRLRRQTKIKTPAPLSCRKSTAKSRPPAKSRAGKAPPKSTRKTTAPMPSTKKSTRTYGRAGRDASAADKENEPYNSVSDDDEDTTDMPEVSMHEVAHSKELEEAKRKFADIDQWDMEFESMSAEDHRSSSQSWR